jgi:C_GCAxxG_C_C family probable redox protein
MKQLSPEMEQRVRLSVDLFMQGFGCCQSVVAAFADLYGMDRNTALRIGAGFGGGIGRLRMVCGAVSGIVTLTGLQCGNTDGEDREGKAHCYKVVQELLERFRQKNGSIICADLLAQNGCKAETDTHMPDQRDAHYYSTRPCARKVEDAARIFAEYLEEQPEA